MTVPQYPRQGEPSVLGVYQTPPPKRSRRRFLILTIPAVLVVAIAVAVSITIGSVNNSVNRTVNIQVSVTSDGQTADVTSTVTSDGGTSESEQNSVAVPYRHDLQLKGQLKLIQVDALASGTATTITCTITADGKRVSSTTSSGAASHAICAYNATTGTTRNKTGFP